MAGNKRKALARKISLRRARSYERMAPNARGVTAISEVNGRGSYAKRYKATKALLRNARKRGAARKSSAPQGQAAFIASQKRKGRSLAQARAAWNLKQGSSGKASARRFAAVASKKRKYKAARPSAARGYAAFVRAQKKKGRSSKQAAAAWRLKSCMTGSGAGKARKKSAGKRKPRTYSAAFGAKYKRNAPKSKAAFMAAQKRKGRSAKQAAAAWNLANHPGRKTFGKGGKKTAKKRKASSKRAVARSYGKGRFRSLTARVGKTSRRTYGYTTKRGRVRKIPDYALLGYRSAAEMRKVARKGGRRATALSKRTAKLSARRERAAETAARKARAGTSLYSPNRGPRTGGSPISFEEWKSMKANKRRKKATKKRRRPTSRRRKSTATRTRRVGTKRRKKTASRRRKTTARKRMRRNAKKRGFGGMSKAKRCAIARKGGRAAARKRGPSKKRRGPCGIKRKARKGTSKKRRASTKRKTTRKSSSSKAAFMRSQKAKGRSVKQAAAAWKLSRRGKGRKKAAASSGPAPRPYGTFSMNGRRRRRRRYHGNPTAIERSRRRRSSYRRNGSYRRNVSGAAFKAELKTALKFGAIVTGGFIAHRLVTNLLDKHVLTKVGALNTGALAEWRPLIAGALAAAIGIPVAVRALPKHAGVAAAGIAASFLVGGVMAALKKANQPELMAAVSAYPDASGWAQYSGMGSYYQYRPRQIYGAPAGMGEYYETAPDPYLEQAAAGMGNLVEGQMLTQAAAGLQQMYANRPMGEYFAYNPEAIGEYEQTAANGYGEVTDNGIHPNLYSAEQALNVAEASAGLGATGAMLAQAAAGFGDLPLEQTVEPLIRAMDIPDEPGGSRAGILSGGDGIFGG